MQDRRLPIELYRPIVEHLGHSCPPLKPLYSLLSTSRAFKEEAERLLYRRIQCPSSVGDWPEITVTNTDRRYFVVFERIAESPRLASYVHHLDLRAFSQTDGGYRANDIQLWTSFVSAYKWMSSLRTLWLPCTELLRRPTPASFNFSLIPNASTIPFQPESFGYLSPSNSELNQAIRGPFGQFFQSQVAGLRELRVEGDDMVVPLRGAAPKLDSAIVQWGVARELLSQGTSTHLTIIFRSWWNAYDGRPFDGAETLRSLWLNRIDMFESLPLLAKSFPFLRFLHVVVWQSRLDEIKRWIIEMRQLEHLRLVISTSLETEATDLEGLVHWLIDTLPMLQCVELLVSTRGLEAEESLFKFRHGVMVERPLKSNNSASRKIFVRGHSSEGKGWEVRRVPKLI